MARDSGEQRTYLREDSVCCRDVGDAFTVTVEVIVNDPGIRERGFRRVRQQPAAAE